MNTHISEWEREHLARLQRAARGSAPLSRNHKRSRNFNCIANLTRFDVVFFAITLVFIGFAIGLPIGIELAAMDAASLTK